MSVVATYRLIPYDSNRQQPVTFHLGSLVTYQVLHPPNTEFIESIAHENHVRAALRPLHPLWRQWSRRRRQRRAKWRSQDKGNRQSKLPKRLAANSYRTTRICRPGWIGCDDFPVLIWTSIWVHLHWAATPVFWMLLSLCLSWQLSQTLY